MLLQICKTYVREKTSDNKILSEFIESIQNKGEDSCMDEELKAIARKLGATETYIKRILWCFEGLTDECHEFFKKQPITSKKDKARLVAAIRSALSE